MDELFILATFEASQLIRISESKIREMAESSELPAFRVGKNWKYRREALLGWVDDQVKSNQDRAARVGHAPDCRKQTKATWRCSCGKDEDSLGRISIISRPPN